MFMDRKTQYCWYINSSQVHLYIQCDPNELQENYFVDIGKLILKFIGKYKTHRIDNTEWKQTNKQTYNQHLK